MTTARKYNLEVLFKGVPKKSDFKVIEDTLPGIKDGGKLCRLSVYIIDKKGRYAAYYLWCIWYMVLCC